MEVDEVTALMQRQDKKFATALAIATVLLIIVALL